MVLTRRERRLVQRPGGMMRILWWRYHRELRLWSRGDNARREHEVLYGIAGKAEPRGLLQAKGLT